MTSGIYIIHNTKNGKVYIGQAKDIKLRWSMHRAQLNNGSHPNPHLLAAWHKYGQAAFSFKILERCDVDQLDIREQHYLNVYMKQRICYNIRTEVDPVRRSGKSRNETLTRFWVRGDSEWVARVRAYTDSIGVPMQDWIAYAIKWGMENLEVALVPKSKGNES